jgi:putative transposase
MKGKRFTEEQIIGILNEAEQVGNIREVCRLHGITDQTGKPKEPVLAG